MKGIKIFPRNRKTKIVNILVNGIEVFLQCEKKKKNMVANNIRFFLKMKNKAQLNIAKIILNCGKIEPLHK